LEHKFKKGIFVRPKLYCYVEEENNELIRKASGVDANKLSYDDYLKLSKGDNIFTNKNIFRLD
jgi:hypothetical protein